MHLSRIDIIATSDGSGEHYEWQVRGVAHKLNPNGLYALYKKSEGVWAESASVTNKDLIDGKFAPKH